MELELELMRITWLFSCSFHGHEVLQIRRIKLIYILDAMASPQIS